MDKTVSIVITFKGTRIDLLKKSVSSFSKQSVKPIEIIIVCRQSEVKDSEKIISKKNLLVKFIFTDASKNQARNIGIKYSIGEYVIYADIDMEAESDLLKKCLLSAQKYDALIIPEKGKGGNFWENCRKLEKELISYDLDTVTPRFFRRKIFKTFEKPFDERFGLLDEWGFNVQIKNKKINVGIVNSYFLVTEDNLTLSKEIRNKFNRGLWMNNFYSIDKNEAWRRVDPIKRGLVFYSSKFSYLRKDPVHFLGLIILKTIDLFAFISGYTVGSVSGKISLLNNKQYAKNLHDIVSDQYLDVMFLKGNWNKYVDEIEKNNVANIWNLNKGKNSDEAILDMGMGPGRWSEFFLGYGYKSVVGLDISDRMIEVAKQRLSKNSAFMAIKGDMENLPFADGKFDKVFTFRAFKYLQNHNDAFKEVDRVLVDGGSFLLEVPNKSLLNLFLKFISLFIVLVFPNIPLESRWRYFSKVKFFSRSDVIKLSANTSLKLVKVKPLFILPSIPLPKVIDKHFSFLVILIEKILWRFLPKVYFTRSWIVLFEKPHNHYEI